MERYEPFPQFLKPIQTKQVSTLISIVDRQDRHRNTNLIFKTGTTPCPNPKTNQNLRTLTPIVEVRTPVAKAILGNKSIGPVFTCLTTILYYVFTIKEEKTVIMITTVIQGRTALKSAKSLQRRNP